MFPKIHNKCSWQFYQVTNYSKCSEWERWKRKDVCGGPYPISSKLGIHPQIGVCMDMYPTMGVCMLSVYHQMGVCMVGVYDQMGVCMGYVSEDRDVHG